MEIILFFAIMCILGYIADKIENLFSDSKETIENTKKTLKNSYIYSVEELQKKLNAYRQKAINNEQKNYGRDNWKFGRDYERYIGYLFEKKGYLVHYNGAVMGTSDSGVDLVCIKDNEVLAVQCKRWKNNVSITDIIKFSKSMENFKDMFHTVRKYIRRDNTIMDLLSSDFDEFIPVFYCTSGYTKDAINFANRNGIICYIENFQSVTEYPPVKCFVQNEDKVYCLPFDYPFDKTTIDFFNGGCYKFTVQEAENDGYRYFKNPNQERVIENNFTKNLSQEKDYEKMYWEDENNYKYTFFHSAYWEYVELKSCQFIYNNEKEYCFSANFIGVMNNILPKVIKNGTRKFRQKKDLVSLPEFYDEIKKCWVTLPRKTENAVGSLAEQIIMEKTFEKKYVRDSL